jgi:hypothetical protein
MVPSTLIYTKEVMMWSSSVLWVGDPSELSVTRTVVDQMPSFEITGGEL